MPKLIYDHYTIRVSDLERSAAFYKEVLGLEEIENRTYKPHIRWFSLGFGELHIAERPDQVVETNVGLHLAMTTPDIETLIETLEAHGVTICDSKGRPDRTTTRGDGVLQIYFQDPDGYWVEVNNAPRTLPSEEG